MSEGGEGKDSNVVRSPQKTQKESHFSVILISPYYIDVIKMCQSQTVFPPTTPPPPWRPFTLSSSPMAPLALHSSSSPPHLLHQRPLKITEKSFFICSLRVSKLSPSAPSLPLHRHGCCSDKVDRFKQLYPYDL